MSWWFIAVLHMLGYSNLKSGNTLTSTVNTNNPRRPFSHHNFSGKRISYYTNSCATFQLKLVVCGDISPNPGPDVSETHSRYAESNHSSNENHRFKYSRNELMDLRGNCMLPIKVWARMKFLNICNKQPTKRGCRAGLRSRNQPILVVNNPRAKTNTESKQRERTISNLVNINISTSPPGTSNHQGKIYPPSFMLMNARSLVKKIDELNVMVTSNNIDIVAVSETWFPPGIDSS